MASNSLSQRARQSRRASTGLDASYWPSRYSSLILVPRRCVVSAISPSASKLACRSIFDRGFENRDDRASYDATDFDERLADLHYLDVCSYAVGHNASGDWVAPDAEGRVTSVFTNPLLAQDVEKLLVADINVPDVERGMDALATAAADVANTRSTPLPTFPLAYASWALAEGPIGDRTERRAASAPSRRNVSKTSRPHVNASSPAIARLKSRCDKPQKPSPL